MPTTQTEREAVLDDILSSLEQERLFAMRSGDQSRYLDAARRLKAARLVRMTACSVSDAFNFTQM